MFFLLKEGTAGAAERAHPPPLPGTRHLAPGMLLLLLLFFLLLLLLLLHHHGEDGRRHYRRFA